MANISNYNRAQEEKERTTAQLRETARKRKEEETKNPLAYKDRKPRKVITNSRDYIHYGAGQGESTTTGTVHDYYHMYSDYDRSSGYSQKPQLIAFDGNILGCLEQTLSPGQELLQVRIKGFDVSPLRNAGYVAIFSNPKGETGLEAIQKIFSAQKIASQLERIVSVEGYILTACSAEPEHHIKVERICTGHDGDKTRRSTSPDSYFVIFALTLTSKAYQRQKLQKEIDSLEAAAKKREAAAAKKREKLQDYTS
jgi:hypothetical protein